MSCSSCIHWNRCGYEAAGNPNHPVAIGQCRRHPPRLNDALLKRIGEAMSKSAVTADEIEFDDDALVAATLWPVTRAGNECGEWQGRTPC